jgi:hypothetical protein
VADRKITSLYPVILSPMQRINIIIITNISLINFSYYYRNFCAIVGLYYALQLYFSGLLLRKVSQRLSQTMFPFGTESAIQAKEDIADK